jgi:hypothetical protein
MIPAKNLGRGLRKFFFWGGGRGPGGVIRFQEILQQICENLEGWSKGEVKRLGTLVLMDHIKWLLLNLAKCFT